MRAEAPAQQLLVIVRNRHLGPWRSNKCGEARARIAIFIVVMSIIIDLLACPDVGAQMYLRRMRHRSMPLIMQWLKKYVPIIICA